jgi:hypothetical protein
MKPKWRPIETAPKDGTPVLLWVPEPMDRKWVVDGKCPNVTIGFHGPANPDYSPQPNWASIEVEDHGTMGGEYTGWMSHWCCIGVEPTHWAPIPSPPDE